jgi:putative redox protein
MRITINRLNDEFLMEAQNEHQNSIRMDSSADGNPQGMSPMQLLLAGIGGCSTIDIISILKKQRQDLQDIQIQVDGERATDEMPKVFRKIHLHYTLKGTLDEDKVKKAIDLSVEKYCSVSKMLEKTATITYSFEIQPLL